MLFENFLTTILPNIVNAATFILTLPFNLLIGFFSTLAGLASSIGLI